MELIDEDVSEEENIYIYQSNNWENIEDSNLVWLRISNLTDVQNKGEGTSIPENQDTLVYIQDQDMIENQEDAGLGLNCPNCGAPLPGLGAKKCIYCDTPIVEYNLRVWNFSRVEEV